MSRAQQEGAKDRIEILGMDPQTGRVALKQLMEEFGAVQGCHIGRRGIDNPIVRYVEPACAEAAMAALTSGRVFLNGMPLRGEWKLTARAPVQDPADEATPTLRELMENPGRSNRPALRDRDERPALRDRGSRRDRGEFESMRALALGDQSRSRSAGRNRSRRARHEDRRGYGRGDYASESRSPPRRRRREDRRRDREDDSEWRDLKRQAKRGARPSRKDGSDDEGGTVTQDGYEGYADAAKDN